MMAEYFLRLAVLLPLLALLIWGSLKLTRWAQSRFLAQHDAARSLQLIETSVLAPGLRLAVVRFRDREILLGCSKAGLVRLGEAEAARETSPKALCEPRS